MGRIMKGRRFLKAFFVITLLVSIVFPLYQIWTSLHVMAHNQYRNRFARLQSTERPDSPSRHFGLTGAELSTIDKDTSYAYTDAVRDGYRLGRGYSTLLQDCLVSDLLFGVASVFGLWACRKPGPTGISG
jgi:hypothetical protein